MKRPLVVALNPSIDAEWHVDAVLWEEKNSVRSERRWAGGKGVNVARWLKHLGAKPQLILPLGGASGRELAALLRAGKIPATVVPLGRPGDEKSATRVNVIITTGKQGQMRFNPAGPELSRAEWRAVVAAVTVALPDASCLILSGSLPRGVPSSAYAQLIRLSRAHGVLAFLDCDGPALAAAANAKPFLVKPNEHELLEWFKASGRRAMPRKISDVARALSVVTGGWVCVSRGAKPALLLNQSSGESFTAKPPRVIARNTVGAGDSMLAAMCREFIRGTSPPGWLHAGLVAASHAVRLRPGRLPSNP